MYIEALVGGGLIGLSTLLFSAGLGGIMGVSGILKGILPKSEKNSLWRYLFLIGIILGVGIYLIVNPEYHIDLVSDSLMLHIVAGILVGLGVSLANGCTSGHAVCGIGRLSLRSLVATITFVLAGIATVTFIQYLF